MSAATTRATVLLLDADTVFVRPPTGDAFSVPWQPTRAAELAAALAGRVSRSAPVVLVVGLALLEVACPTLPPVSRALQQQMLRRDADRYFALMADQPSAAVAVAVQDAWAFAMPAAVLETWLAAFRTLGPIAAVVTVAQAAAWAGASGLVPVDAGSTAHGALTFAAGTLRDVRRRRAAAGDVGADDATSPVDRDLIAKAALRALDAPLDHQLLDTVTQHAVARARQTRTVRSVVMLGAAAALLLWSLHARRERQITALEREVAALEQQTAPLREAQARWLRARDEAAELTALSAHAASDVAPDAVLVRLGALLPPDAFIQRLTWDGTQWRIDGSAQDAAALTAALAGDATLRDVRSAAPSTRFVENGRTRSSFAITFALAGDVPPDRGGASGQ